MQKKSEDEVQYSNFSYTCTKFYEIKGKSYGE